MSEVAADVHWAEWRICGRDPGEFAICDPGAGGDCAGTHRVYLSFHNRGAGCFCSFLEPDAKTPAGRKREFGSPDKIRDMIARTPTRQDQSAKQSLEYGIEIGRGGLFLELTAEQYRKLKS